QIVPREVSAASVDGQAPARRNTSVQYEILRFTFAAETVLLKAKQGQIRKRIVELHYVHVCRGDVRHREGLLLCKTSATRQAGLIAAPLRHAAMALPHTKNVHRRLLQVGSAFG